jgi:ADP-heptose:LPS heptosyltransferase
VDRILIVKLDRIGDMVNTTPVLEALRHGFPGARLDVVGHPLSLGLLQGDDRVKESIAYKSWLYHALPVRLPGPWSCWVVMKLLARRYQLVVYLRGSIPLLLLGLTSRLAAAKFVEGEPVIDRYFRPLEQLLGPISDRQPRLRVQPDVLRAVHAVLSGEGDPAGPRIVIHVAASTATKVWPAERFSELADRLRSTFGAEVHLLGGVADRGLLEAIAARAVECHAIHWSLSLPQVVALIQACDLFIGGDSGLSHIAAAVGTRMVVIWGPVNLSMARPQAPPERCLVLYHDLPCRTTCPEIRCNNPIRLDCLMRTRVSDVVSAAQSLLWSSDQAAPVYAGAAVSSEEQQ